MTPNGVALSPDGRTLYYAETAGARLWAFDIDCAGPGAQAPVAVAARRAHAGGLAGRAASSASIRWPSTPSATCTWPR